MWQERWKAWIAALRARFAKQKPAAAEPADDNGIDSDYETIVVGARRSIDWRRYALPVRRLTRTPTSPRPTPCSGGCSTSSAVDTLATAITAIGSAKRRQSIDPRAPTTIVP